MRSAPDQFTDEEIHSVIKKHSQLLEDACTRGDISEDEEALLKGAVEVGLEM